VILVVVNGAMGALIGLLVAMFSGYHLAVVVCAILGAVASFLVRKSTS
jgi:hypothetical protein